MSDDYITAGEFTRWRQEETQFRVDLNGRLDELLRLVRTQNGRVFAQEKHLAVIERRLMAIESEDSEIDKTVKDILKNGCDQYKTHAQILGVLEGAGVMPNQDGAAPRAGFSLSALSPRQKIAAGAGVTALVIPAISDLFQLGKVAVEWAHHVADKVP